MDNNIVMVEKNNINEGRPINNIVGQVFGGLTVIEATNRRLSGRVVFVCKCSCGMKIETTGNRLEGKRYPLKHCGCQGYGPHNYKKPGALGIGGVFSKRKRKTNNSESALNNLYLNYQNQAQKRGYKWNISKQQFLSMIKKECFYCGGEPSRVHKIHGNECICNGIDRLDSNQGYEINNCVPCCWECNHLKGNLNKTEFIQIIKRIYKYTFGGAK